MLQSRRRFLGAVAVASCSYAGHHDLEHDRRQIRTLWR
ncbi:twin-arginine translocation signal domain-containing protein (plasmid) [Rhizobium sp. CCGE531]|nr:twin-arginine translocation signal domain-containing protein [Rhizobium sp. CCGE531]AYG75951.1 twin-arginine translocation signal domain-containing protein [Rhizobium sp. CCGE532]